MKSWKCLHCGAESPSYTPAGLYLGRVFFLLAVGSAGGLWFAQELRPVVVWTFATLFTMSGMKGAYEYEMQERDRVFEWLREHERLEERNGEV